MQPLPYRHRIAKVLLGLDGQWLDRAHCYLGGGAALMLQMGGYRETRGIDFFCGTRAGFRMLRNAVARPGLGGLLKATAFDVCGVHCSQNKIEVFFAVDGLPVRVMFMCAQPVTGLRVSDLLFDVPLLSRKDMYVSKLLANTDRGVDHAGHHRDLIDLAMMVKAWGPVPQAAWREATLMYGGEVARSLATVCGLISDRSHLIQSLWSLSMYTSLVDTVCTVAGTLCNAYRDSMLSALGSKVDHGHVELQKLRETA